MKLDYSGLSLQFLDMIWPLADKGDQELFSFNSIKIPLGAILEFADNPKITARVMTDNKVEFEGKLMSLSGAALRHLDSIGIKRASIQGPKMWKFEGVPLTQIKLN
jgi:hypothetical protein